MSMFGAEFRRVESRDHLGKPALVIAAIRTYDTTASDLWEAITTRERIARWFGSVEGELRLGGRYLLKGANVSGSITRCDPVEALDLTWESMETLSWVTVRLAPEGRRARLTLEHIAHKDGTGQAAEFFKQFGPAAGGVGWDIWLHSLGRHLAAPSAPLDHEAFEAWASSTSEGKAFARGSAEAWAAADEAGGESSEEARARAERTIAFYTGA